MPIDPLAKTPADKLVIARQAWLQAKARLRSINDEHDKAVEAEMAALKRLEEAQQLFDKTYGGA